MKTALEIAHDATLRPITDIAKSLQSQGFNIEPGDVNLPGKLDRIDTYQVQVKFADDLATEVKVWVAPDAESKAGHDRSNAGCRGSWVSCWGMKSTTIADGVDPESRARRSRR